MTILDAYQILGLVPGSPGPMVKRAYRTLAKKWHPDRFATRPHQRAEAEEKIKRINVAFELIQREGDLLALALRAQRSGRPSTAPKPAGSERPPAANSNPQKKPDLGRPRPDSEVKAAAPKTVRQSDVPTVGAKSRRGSVRHGAIFASAFALFAIALFLFLTVGRIPGKRTGQAKPESGAGTEQNPGATVVRPYRRSEVSAFPDQVVAGENPAVKHQSSTAILSAIAGMVDREPQRSQIEPAKIASEPTAENRRDLAIQEVVGSVTSNGVHPVASTGDAANGFELAARLGKERALQQESADADHLARAVEDDLANKYYQIGQDYMNQNPVDYESAAKYFRLGAEGGNVDAQRNLGFLYASGKGVPRDAAQAEDWLSRSAKKGDSIATIAGSILKRMPEPTEPAREPVTNK